jgi:hypothetical protein
MNVDNPQGSSHPRAGWAEAAEQIADDPVDHEWLDANLTGELNPDEMV